MLRAFFLALFDFIADGVKEWQRAVRVKNENKELVDNLKKSKTLEERRKEIGRAHV
jgi:hypothetical protein